MWEKIEDPFRTVDIDIAPEDQVEDNDDVRDEARVGGRGLEGPGTQEEQPHHEVCDIHDDVAEIYHCMCCTWWSRREIFRVRRLRMTDFIVAGKPCHLCQCRFCRPAKRVAAGSENGTHWQKWQN
jgi:hypothetical protein